MLKLDAARIELVLQNFIDNALKYTPPGGTITIRVAATGRYVKISIKDTGIGVPRIRRCAYLPNFSRGERGEEANRGKRTRAVFSKTSWRATGKRSVETEEGKGSTFSFTLPLDEDKLPEAEEKAKEF